MGDRRTIYLDDVFDAIENESRNGHYSCFASFRDAEKFKQIVNELPSAEQNTALYIDGFNDGYEQCRQDTQDLIDEYIETAQRIKCKDAEDMLMDLADDVRNLPSAQRWIPCSERLPYSQEDVLCDDKGQVTIGYYTDEEIGWHDMHSYRIYPTAWMPLPEPYNERI